MTQAKPEGAHTLTAHLVVRDGAAAIEFYKKAFGAVEECRMNMPGSDAVMHAGLRIGDSQLMLGCECPDGGNKSAETLGATPVTIHMYVDNVDEAFKKALNAGATELMAPADMFWGDRYGRVKDPFGHEWSLATHVRDMTPDQMKAEAEAFFQDMQPVG